MTVDEVVVAVRLLLGTKRPGYELTQDYCGLDRNLDKRVTVDEVVEAVNSLISGCR
ncbi:MAG: hypothetical protein N3C12_02270 [Candidatus Binatia bacterium]|nr:hypothetical protein [Candidatus Binatia bacterium]